MQIAILNNFHGDKEKKIDTTTAEGRAEAAQLIEELLKSGSTIFLERQVEGQTESYRVSGYHAESDRIVVSVAAEQALPAKAEPEKPQRRRGPYRKASLPSEAGRLTAAAPSSGGATPGTGLSWESVRAGVAALCEERGWHHGVPMPSSANPYHRMILAPGAPLAAEKGANIPVGLTEPQKTTFVCRESDIDESDVAGMAWLQNGWRTQSREVEVYRCGRESTKLEIPVANLKLRMLMDTITLRAGAVEAAAEMTAMLALREKIKARQFDCYLLNGAFPETSPRSHITYILRKGLPTLAFHIEDLGDGREKQNFLTALCLHPLAYYENTFCGCCPPTDEVMTHLMLIRTDEAFLWRKAGHHSIDDPRAGI